MKLASTEEELSAHAFSHRKVLAPRPPSLEITRGHTVRRIRKPMREMQMPSNVDELKTQLRQARKELAVLKKRPPIIDPLREPLKGLPNEIKDMIRIEVLRMTRPVGYFDLAAFFKSTPIIADNVQVAHLLRRQYAPLFLKGNTIDANDIYLLDLCLSNPTYWYNEDRTGHGYVRAAKVTVSLTDYEDSSDGEDSNLDQMLPLKTPFTKLRSLKNMQHLDVILMLDRWQAIHSRKDAEVAVTEVEGIETFQRLSELKTIKVCPHAEVEEASTEDEVLAKQQWLEKAASALLQRFNEVCPTCHITLDGVETHKLPPYEFDSDSETEA